MNTNSNVYTIVYAAVLVIIVAFLLALANAALKPRQDANVALSQKKQILASINERNLGDQKSEETYEAIVSDAQLGDLTFYIAKKDGEKYILPVRGAGLWGGIWGYIALNEDKNTIYGTYFDHESETPGLGGEIKTEAFQNQFIGKHLLRDGKFVGVAIMKAGQTADGMDQVDAISGATITSKGVETMILTSIQAFADKGFFEGVNSSTDETGETDEISEQSIKEEE
ncbi:MAG: NADH:ubiquinone reductase (Na(+)-transporting) subunit C [Paludibacteraceae bacterium]|nr:NADH:ubiquinone reductase (Na(+)-transporting) subunit C [Paludibacteraceae bacterium]MBQ3914214.1 NADH:ubiquinone reductase (Na(+)-transporting) subunit C [Paludibacteraceae bacterium]